jgi:hypothetical protein
LKYQVVRVDDTGDVCMLKEAYSLMDLGKMDIHPGYFPSIFITKDDLRASVTGGDIDEIEDINKIIARKINNLKDADMSRIAQKLQDCYVGESYWSDLQYLVEEYKIIKPKVVKPKVVKPKVVKS